jgi:hypothetical protein
MNRFAIPAIFLLLLASLACAQDASSAPPKPLPQATDSSSSSGNTLALPGGAVIVAKLTAGIETSQCKPGDPVNAQVTHDVKDGSRTVIKKGALISGKISKVETAPEPGGLYGLWMVFDKVALKAGEPDSLPMDIQAIAPPETGGTDNLNGVDTGALMAGHRSASEGTVELLTAKSRGAIALPGIDIAIQTLNGVHLALLVSKKGNFRLAKGSQIVFRVVTP